MFALSAPMFSRAQIDLPGGHRLMMTAPGASTSTHVHHLSVDGKSWACARLPASLLTGAGAVSRQPATGELAFTLSSTADRTWAGPAADAPPSYAAGPLHRSVLAHTNDSPAPQGER